MYDFLKRICKVQTIYLFLFHGKSKRAMKPIPWKLGKYIVFEAYLNTNLNFRIIGITA